MKVAIINSVCECTEGVKNIDFPILNFLALIIWFRLTVI